MVDRELMLDAAERVIARDGSTASLEAIALEAGVTKPIIYARIGNRADLANALAQRLTDRLTTAAGKVIGSDRVDRTTLAAFVTTSLQTIADHRELYFYVTRGTADDTPQRTLYLAERSATPLADLLGRWRTRHGLDPDMALPWAYSVIGMLNLVSLWWLHESDRPADVLGGQLADLLWAGLATE